MKFSHLYSKNVSTSMLTVKLVSVLDRVPSFDYLLINR